MFYERIKNVISHNPKFCDKFANIIEIEEYLKEYLTPFSCTLYKTFLPLNAKTRSSQMIFQTLDSIFNLFSLKCKETIKKHKTFQEMFDENKANCGCKNHDVDLDLKSEEISAIHKSHMESSLSTMSTLKREGLHEDHRKVKSTECIMEPSSTTQLTIDELEKSQYNKNFKFSKMMLRKL